MKENLKEFKEKSDTFIEYYYLFGIDANTILNEMFDQENKYFNKELNLVQPKLLSKFPPNRKKISDINENVLKMHCFPNDFLIIESDIQPKEEIFHFSLDNLQYSELCQKIYFTTMIIYEPLKSYRNLVIKYDELIKKEISKNELNLQNIEEIIKRKKKQLFLYKRKNSYELTSLLSKSLNDKITLKRKNSFGFFRNYTNNKSKNEKEKNYYIPKAICLSSLVPFPNEKEEILTLIYNKIKSNSPDICLEKIIENLTLEIPFPTRGCNTYKYKLFNQTIDLYQQPLNSVNFYSYKMNLIFNFSLNDIIEIFKYLLLEVPMLFFCTNKNILTNIVETFISFLSPFDYQYPNISILPILSYGLIEISKTFIFGINEKYTKKFFNNHNLHIINKTIQIVNIDEKKLDSYYYYDKELPIVKLEELGNKQMRESIAITQKEEVLLPSKYKSKLINKLKKHCNTLKNQNRDIFLNDSNLNLADYFYYFLVSILIDYFDYMYNEEKEVLNIAKLISTNPRLSINELFKVDEFLNKYKSERIFYKKFFETKIFYNFCAKRYLRQSFEDRINILFFDEKIANKKSKKLFAKEIDTPFLKFEKFKNTTCLPTCTIVPYSKSEKNYILKQTTSINNTPLNYFQDITENSTSYILFPRLLYDNYFFKEKYKNENIRKPYINTSYFNYCTQIDTENKYHLLYEGILVTQYHLSSTILKTFTGEMKSYVLKHWLRLFAMTFYYCEKTEKHFRFYEMLDNLQKTEYLNKPLISFIYSSVVKYGNEFMAIKMYETIEKMNFIQNYTEYAYLCSKLANEVENKSFMKKFSIKTTTDIELVYYKEKNEESKVNEPIEAEISKIKKRTLGLKTEEEPIQYDTTIKCPKCGKENDLTNLTIQFESKTKEYEMCKCDSCKKESVPSAKVRIGESDMTESFLTCSSYYLYKITDNLVREYGIKLDLDILRKNQRIFWNSIWYFTIGGISYDILLKYKDNFSQEENISDNRKSGCSESYIKDQGIDFFEDLSIQKKVINLSYISTKSNDS